MDSLMSAFGVPKFTESEAVGQEACYKWPLGQCKSGSGEGGCAREHHSNLSPYQLKELPDFVIDNEPGKACHRCNNLGIECDKLGRNGSDDPCSECRWFAGGTASKCMLVTNTSLNDQCWYKMMTRGNQGYTLPEPRPKDEVKQMPAKVVEEHARRQREAQPPSPMDGVKRDWKGETRDELLAKPYPLPPPVRAHPRAYLVPPRPSSALQNTRGYHAAQTQRDGKRKRGDRAAPPPALAPNVARSPQQQYPPPIMTMPMDTFGRKPTRCMWDDIDKTWTNWYADGGVTVSAPYKIGEDHT